MSWSLFLDQEFQFYGSPASGEVLTPIDGLTGNQLVIEAINPEALPTWKVAFRVIFQRELTDFPGGAIVAESYGRKILLSRKVLMDVPQSIASPYSILLAVPFWHQQLQIKIWQK